MISPTGRGVRNDSKGRGHYGASRGNRIHKGTDFESVEGQVVVAPFDMRIVRLANPYANSYLAGIAFKTETSEGKIFYFNPDNTLIGKEVKQGDTIGIAQSLKPKYGPKIIDHVHFQFDSFDPMVIVQLAQEIRSIRKEDGAGV